MKHAMFTNTKRKVSKVSKKLFTLLTAVLFTLQIQAQLVVTTNNITCYGMCDGSITIDTAYNAATPLTISINGVVSALNTFSNMCAGTYVLEYLDASGNWYSPATMVTLNEPDSLYPLLIITLNDTVLVAEGGTAPYAYTWVTSGLPITPIPISNYFNTEICVTDVNGCMTCDTISVINYTCDSLQFSIAPNQTGNTVIFNANVNLLPYTYTADWVYTEINTLFSLVDTGMQVTLPLNQLDTFVVCLNSTYSFLGGVVVNNCTICDTFMFDGTSWLLMSMGQPTAIHEQNQNQTLLKVTDVLGRESKSQPNVPLFYIYDDGTVEKKIIIE